MKNIAVIGGGISGLSAAYRAKQNGHNVTLFESSPRVGGVIHTLHEHGCLLECGPDCWAGTKPAGVELARDLGLEDQLIGTRTGVRRSFILHNGTLKRLPEGFYLMSPMSVNALRKTDALSFGAKVRMARELFIGKRQETGDESLASFVRRRFGQEALDRIAQPMIAGIYSADPEKLSLQATFPQFLEYEQEYGSVIRALRKRAKQAPKTKGAETAKASGPRYGMFVSLRGGMGSLINALVDAIDEDNIRLNTPVQRIEFNDTGTTVHADDADQPFDAVVLALPAYASAKLLVDHDAELSERLAAIEYSGTSVANFIFERDQIRHPMDGIGAVIPLIEQRKIVAFSFSSVKFENRAPADKVVLRVFLGNITQSGLEHHTDDELQQIALNEARDLIGIDGEPVFAACTRHSRAMAQYHVGHKQRVEKIRALESNHPRLALIGNGYEGIGMPDCVRGANESIDALTESLS